MKLPDILPRLRMSYHSGELVPFIGAGMSIPACSNWSKFVDSLWQECQQYGASEFQSVVPSESMPLIPVADRAIQYLERLGNDVMINACRNALKGEKPDDIPKQTRSLAKIYWPMVITTNYDDLYSANALVRPIVLGRNVSDCQFVLSSLDFDGPPILWALQGYLGGQSCDSLNIPKPQADELARQIVVGHHQYQQVMNSMPHFRRAFSEVFRRRSFLFMGAGLREDYIVNLFGEVLTHYGPNPHAHFAFLRADDGEHRASFLQHRLNTTVITYDSHDELPSLLDELEHALTTPKVHQIPGTLKEERFLLKEDGTHLKIVLGTLPVPSQSECAAVSLGKCGDQPILGGMARQYLEKLGVGPGKWNMVQGCEFVYKLDKCSVYGIAARKENDRRDLRLVGQAVEELMGVAKKACHSTIHIGLIAAGPGKKWKSAFSLIEMVRGVRKFASKCSGNCPSVHIYIVDPSVIFRLRSKKISIRELLSSQDIRFWIEVQGSQSDTERIMAFFDESATLGDVARSFLIPDEGWIVEVLPSPFGDQYSKKLTDVYDRSLADFGVVPYGIVRFLRIDQSEDGITPS